MSTFAFHAPAQAGWKPQRLDGVSAHIATAVVAPSRLRGGAPQAVRSTAPGSNVVAPAPMTATAAAPGQTGYIHYFLLRMPDGSAEMQVGIELSDQTIAWSFPGSGIAVSPFIEKGTLTGHGGLYEVQHLFGIRPFPDDAAMAALASALPSRVMPWIEDGVQHCDVDPPQRGEACVSCLGFVLRILFPGEFPTYPALPTDFKQARAGDRYTTEDLLVYLAGLHKVATREARVGRINAFDVPPALREELLRVVSAEDAVQVPELRPAARGRVVRPAGKGAKSKAAQRPRRL